MISPHVLIIFGATGDLMSRKLMPALYSLYKGKHISQDLYIVGVGRRELSVETFREDMMVISQQASGERFEKEIWEQISKRIFYEHGFFEDAALYARLATLLASLDEKMNACVPRFFYLATPPQHYGTILEHLNSSGLAEGCGPASRRLAASRGGHGTNNFTRVLIEKPFGNDLTTAQNLERQLSTIFEEKQIYRIDHYLGKETLQNILAFRFANGIFEPTWNNKFIDHVQIHLSEELGVGTRGAFYDGVGALRDVVQNHMLQMLSLIAMDEPRGFSPETIRDARVAAMKAVRPVSPEDITTMVVRGQYDAYRKEAGVEPVSETETFVALKLFVDTPRFAGVPFYLRTGKRLEKKVTEISIHFKKPVCPDEVCFFNPDSVYRNVLTLRVAPEEGIRLRLMAKKPGFGLEVTPTQMQFRYSDSFTGGPSPEAYERLLLDAITGDQTLFARTDEIESSWQFMMGILDGWKSQNPPLHLYKAGSNGPDEADVLIEKDSRHWFLSGK